MVKGLGGKRHAQAVFELALEKNELDKWKSDLSVMKEKLGDPRLIGLLENPKVPFPEKQKILKKVLKGVGPLAMNLSFLLVSKNRLGLLSDIVSEYELLLDAHQGREHAEVTTAISLKDKDKRTLQQKLSTAREKEVVLDTRVDSEIVGGMVVRIGDRLIDGSVRTRLDRLRKGLIEAENV